MSILDFFLVVELTVTELWNMVEYLRVEVVETGQKKSAPLDADLLDTNLDIDSNCDIKCSVIKDILLF